jgi:tetratricopeptide (TPR) repeat protein
MLHLEISHALAKLDDPTGAMAADVAHHAALGGDDELCVRASITAGERCLRMFAAAEAQALADRGRQRLERLATAVRVPLHMSLLRLSIEAGMWRTCARELESELSRAVLEAQSAGLQADVAVGWELLSELHEEEGNLSGAQASISLSEQASRDADPETKARTIARAGRCLVQLEREIPKAKALLEEALVLSAPMKLELPDIPMGLGLVEHYLGNHDAAGRLLEEGWATGARQLKHWLACESLSRLIIVLLEWGRADAALARCAELEPLAAKLGEGSELPFALTLKALAQLALGQEGAPAEVERSLTRLREIDTKGHLAFALNVVAEADLASGDTASAKARAEEALRAAETVGRRSEVARSRAVLARLAQRADDTKTARAHIEALRDDLSRPLGLATGTRKAITELAAELGVAIPTEIPTKIPTPGGNTRARTRTASS